MPSRTHRAWILTLLLPAGARAQQFAEPPPAPVPAEPAESPAAAAPQQPDATKPSEAEEQSRGKAAAPRCENFSEKQHLFGLLLDAGKGADSFGVRYHHAHMSGGACNGLGGFGVLGYGVDLRTVPFSAGTAYASAQLGGLGDVGGVGFELGVGGGSDFSSDPVAAGIVGLFFGLYYVELGASYQFPIGDERPYWLGGLQFALRINIPIWRYDVSRTPRSLE